MSQQLTGEKVELHGNPVWVAEIDGKVVGLVACRLVWQIEPLQVFPEVENQMTRRRIACLLYRRVDSWLKDRERNATGVYTAFAVTRNHAVVKWAKASGWFRQYIGAAVITKKF